MSTEILTFTPAFGLKEGVQYNTAIFQAQSGLEKRHSLWSRKIRFLNCELHEESVTDVDVIWDFFCARKGKYDPFWVKFPSEKNRVITDEAVGTGNGSLKTFDLDAFPIDTSFLVVKHDGVVVSSGFTVANNTTDEKTTITYASAPASGVVITASYEFYIQVRFTEDAFEREKIAAQLYNTGIVLIEVLWNNYVAP